MKILIILPLLLLSIQPLQAQTYKAKADSTDVFIGKNAPFFEITTVDGKKYNLSELKGKIVVLNFWFIGCAPCRKEIPHLNSLATENAQRKDIIFLAVSNIDTQEALQYVQKRWEMKFELVAKGQAVATAYKIGLYPTNFVIDRKGKVVFEKNSYSETIKQEIQEVINHL